MTGQSAYQPHVPLRRPGSRPAFRPVYRVLVHRRYQDAWDKYVVGAGLESAQQCWDHLACTPNRQPQINSVTKLRGKNFAARNGFSAVLHYRVSSFGRVDYRYHDNYTDGAHGDPHPVVMIDFVGPSTSGT